MINKLSGNLCVLLPTVNELRNLKILIPQLQETFPGATILVVDDGSTDGSNEYLEKLQHQSQQIQFVQRGSRLGIGSAHLTGMSYASRLGYTYLITMDADLTHRTEDAKSLFEKLDKYDIVIGSRYLQHSKIKNWNCLRLAMTWFGHISTRMFFETNIDMSSGLRGYKIESIDVELLEKNCPSNYEFFFVSVLIFLKLKMTISQVPILLNARGFGKSKMSIALALRGGLTLLLYGLRLKRVKI
jgi:dolichol-phosphate mannosyltransferase